MRGTQFKLLTAVTVVLAVHDVVRAQAGCTTDRATISAERGLIFEDAGVIAGQWYWKLVDVAWCLPEQNGFKINIFVRARDANGNYITNQAVRIGYPHSYPDLPPNQLSVMTKAFPDWGDYPMAGGNWCPFWPTGPRGPYAAWVVSACPANGSSCPSQPSYPSDRVWGMGLPCNQHESYFLTWQFTQAPPPPGPPVISRSPASFSDTIICGDSVSTRSFTVQNTGGGTLTYSISDDAVWLSVNPAGGTSDGETDAIALNYATSTLTPGHYVGQISIADAAATNSPQTIMVTLDVFAPGDFDHDGDVDMSDFGLLQTCFSGQGVHQPLPACADVTLDDDTDVDQNDFGIFAECLNGADVPPAPGCCSN